MRILGTLMFAVLMLSGCGTTWYNSRLPDPIARERQLGVDKAYCVQVAAGIAPIPALRTYSQESQSYTVQGQFSVQGSNGPQTGTYRAQVAPIPNPGAAFENGVSNGVAIGAALRAKRQQDEILKHCMYRLGWTDTASDPSSSGSKVQATGTDSPMVSLSQQMLVPPSDRDEAKSLSCEDWGRDIAVAVDSARRVGVPRDEMNKAAQSYIRKSGRTSRDLLIFMSIISIRYGTSEADLSASDFPRYVAWECRQGWKGYGLSTEQ
ncbi:MULTISPECIES: hypothetical protein [unclassified Herbaspirillum]|uniref:hypothetical protein n=1 Tax=unclassified Herbaspirillum TaxID=2624150 RepID=UPI00115384DC|nr:MULTISPECIES: hypothetical protein [unclassified Herbaspirillum]MBB5393028.1 hypothetical protein [Herbaspirillum sp. SJZ102]TQK04328.1 hypothetical protein FB599_2880 [Herbaspirillum sp. SJZ130]TQK09887.1 hypothetical protein FB598_2882 [Herbaspirillum sp. SJZ106]